MSAIPKPVSLMIRLPKAILMALLVLCTAFAFRVTVESSQALVVNSVAATSFLPDLAPESGETPLSFLPDLAPESRETLSSTSGQNFSDLRHPSERSIQRMPASTYLNTSLMNVSKHTVSPKVANYTSHNKSCTLTPYQPYNDYEKPLPILKTSGGVVRNNYIYSQDGKKCLYHLHRNQTLEFFGGQRLHRTALGTGAFGTVYSCTRLSDKKRIAAKVQKIRNDALRAEAEFECKLHQFLSEVEPNFVVKLEDAFELKYTLHYPEIVLMTEIATGGNMFSAMKTLTPTDIQQFPILMAKAVAAMHNHDYAHLDLHPGNFVYDDESRNVIKLIDFGKSKQMERQPYKTHWEQPIANVMFQAPEYLDEWRYSQAADIYSLGVSICVIYMKNKLGWGNPDFSGYFSKHEEKMKADGVPEKIIRFIHRYMVTRGPDYRATAQQVVDFFEHGKEPKLG